MEKFLKCPGCGLQNTVPEDLLNYRYLLCNNCGTNVKNPHRKTQPITHFGITMSLQNWNASIFATAIMVILLIIYATRDPERDRRDYIENQKIIYRHEKEQQATKEYYDDLDKQAKAEVDNEE